jgi:hypothetical protein
MQGRNLSEVLANGEDVPETPIFTERWGNGLAMFGSAGGALSFDGDFELFLGQWAVIEGHWKTVVTRSTEQELGPDGKPLLGADQKPVPRKLRVDLDIFDLTTDMTDSHSLIASERPRAEAAAKRLENWLREMKKLNERYSNENTTNDDAQAALRALGYAQ